jgi:glucosylceramidase
MSGVNVSLGERDAQVSEAGPSLQEAGPSQTVNPRPAVITSSADAFWVEGQLTEGVDVNADIVLDPETQFQTWEGFGGTFDESGWVALEQLEPEERARAMRLLFDANEGARFAWGSLPIGADAFALDRYSLDDEDGDLAMDHFSIERDELHLIPFLDAALNVNPDLRLIAMPWSPPAWMKTTLSMDRGQIRTDDEVLAAYALYLARYVEAYADEGFEIEAIHVQNDITFEDDLPSCAWDAVTLSQFVGEHLGPLFQQREIASEIWLGAFGEGQYATLPSDVMADPIAAQFVHGFGLSWDTSSLIPTLRADYGLPIIQTQHEPGNNPWEASTFNPDDAPNDFAFGERTWVLLKTWLEAGVNAYFAWNMVLDHHDEGLNTVRPWPKNSLLVVDPTTNSLRATPAYFVFRHFSYFIEPGAVRILATAERVSLETLAFKNPDGGVVAVVHNPDELDRDVTLEMGERRWQFGIPAHGWATVNVL